MATAHPEAEEAQDDDPNELEATELHPYQNAAHSRPPSSTTTAMDADAGTGDLEPLPRRRRSIADMVGRVWRRHVVVTVSHEACRDHLGMFNVNDRIFQITVMFPTSGPFYSLAILYLFAICTYKVALKRSPLHEE